MTEITDNFSDYSYTYNNANRLTEVDNGGTPSMPSVVLTYGYDAAGNRISLTDNVNGVTAYAYDDRNWLSQITQSGTGIAEKRVDFVTDAAGRRAKLTRYSDLDGKSTVLVTTYAYDQANRLTTLVHKTAGNTVRSQYDYTLDDAGRLSSESRSWNTGGASDTVTYGYTDDDQLTSVSHTNMAFAGETFSYDDNGNRVMTGYDTDPGNRMSSDGTFDYTYDAEGNMISKTEISSGDEWTYTWDHRNRLTKVEATPFMGSPSTVATYTYDALDRRIKVVVGSATRWTAYDGVLGILDFNGAGSVTARYLQGDVVDEVLARETSGNTVAWYLPDRLGTIRDLANNSGAIIDHIDYTAYGEVEAESAPSTGDRWKFTGRELDSETGLYQFRARYYYAAAGRFVSGDPIGFAGGDANLYRYVGNATSNISDPTGLEGAPTGFWNSLSCSWRSMSDSMLKIPVSTIEYFGGDVSEYLVVPDWEEIYRQGPLGQTDGPETPPWAYYGTRASLAIATAAAATASSLIIIEQVGASGLVRISQHAAKRMEERVIHKWAVRQAISCGTRRAALESQKGPIANTINFLTKSGYEILAAKNDGEGVLFVVRNIWTNKIVTVIYKGF